MKIGSAVSTPQPDGGKPSLQWYDYLSLNSYGFGLSLASGILTPVLIPYLILLFMPAEQKNTYLATLRVITLAVAMFIQPLAGMFSDRSTLRWGRRRPFIFISAIFSVAFLAIVAFSTDLRGVPGGFFGWPLAFAVLMGGSILLQISSNIGQAASQGLIPDLVAENQRGRASGVKSVLELLPVFLVIGIGPLVDKGYFWLVVGIIMLGFLVTMGTTLAFVKEQPLKQKSTAPIGGPALRLVALTVIFVAITQAAVWLVKASGDYLSSHAASTALQVGVVGLAGLAAMAGSIFLGVYFGAYVGIGKDARQRQGFIWWVVNRLLFLAAVGSIQGFAQFYLRDVVKVPNAATMTTYLLAAVALFLIPAALLGGNLADRIGRKRLVGLSGLVAAAGTLLLLVAGPSIPLIIASGAIIGAGTGVFYATNWALGTDLVPKQDAGKYLGISNLAGAGAGIVGAGIGGPMADFFNQIAPGLGYIVIFSIYGLLFLLSTLTLSRVK
jgi:MFS family permease